jgi:hypothetical protein
MADIHLPKSSTQPNHEAWLEVSRKMRAEQEVEAGLIERCVAWPIRRLPSLRVF